MHGGRQNWLLEPRWVFLLGERAVLHGCGGRLRSPGPTGLHGEPWLLATATLGTLLGAAGAGQRGKAEQQSQRREPWPLGSPSPTALPSVLLERGCA